MIDKALIRELKEPEKSLRRAKSIIDDRMNNFELNNIIYPLIFNQSDCV